MDPTYCRRTWSKFYDVTHVSRRKHWLTCYFMYRISRGSHTLRGSSQFSRSVDIESMHDSQIASNDFGCTKEFSWNVLITNHIKCGSLHHAFMFYEKMQQEHCLYPNGHTFVALLKACVRLNDQERGLKVNAAIVRLGLIEIDPFVGSSIVNMYLSFGLVAEAQHLLYKLPTKNVVSWTALITGWVKHGCGEEALSSFERMQLAGVPPDAVTFISGLKACSLLKFVEKGAEMHTEIERMGLLGKHLALGNALIHMYARCGSLAIAQDVFDLLPCRDITSWTALIAGYVEAGHGDEALKVFDLMQHNLVPPNNFTYTCSLKACSVARKPYEGQKIHADIETKSLLAGNILVGNALVDMYAKCGLLAEAQQIFDRYIIRDVVSWNVLIGGYMEHGQGSEALSCFEQMQVSGIPPNAVTFASSLKACTIMGAIDIGLALHAEVARKGLMETDMVIGNALVDMYAQCALMDKAQEVFDKLPVKNVFIWNALISGYAEHGHIEKAINCFEQMQFMGISPDAATIVSCLKAYVRIGATCKVDQILNEIESSGLEEIDSVVGTAFVDIYAKRGLLQRARQVFNKLPKQNVIAWNSLVAGYVEHVQGEEALQCLEQMQLEGVLPNTVSFVYGLKASTSIRDIGKGIQIHSEVSRKDLLRKDVHIGSSLVDMYAKCGALERALEVFEELPSKNVISWNALISGYVEHGFGKQAMECFERMQDAGIPPDLVSYLCALKACGIVGAIDRGRDIHAEMLFTGMLENDIVGNALVDMYAKCGMLITAQQVFDNVSVRSLITWNTLIVGYEENGLSEEALECFAQMQLEGVNPNYVSFTYSLKACGCLGATEKGRELHAEIERQGLLEKDLVGTALVDMYGKLGLLVLAQEVFDKLSCRSIVSWNLLISGYAEKGECNHVFDVFGKMLKEGLKPDCVTFVVLLSMCSQRGLFGKGQTYFNSMSEDHGIVPTLEHHTCMVNLLGRAGELDKLATMIMRLPFSPDLALWRSVLVTCINLGNVELGRSAFKQALRLDEDPTAYVLMANIHATASIQ